MLKNTMRKGLVGRLVRGDLGAESAIAVASGIYPGAGFQPPLPVRVGEKVAIDATEGFIRGQLTADRLFNTVFGVSEREALGYPPMPAADPQPDRSSDRDEVVLEAEIATYSGWCINCNSTASPVYPGWKMVGLWIWACETCIRNKGPKADSILEIVDRFNSGSIELIVAQDGKWVGLSELHRSDSEG